MRAFLVVTALISTLLTAGPVAAYQIKAADQTVRAGAGGSFNFVRHRLVTRETPPALAALTLVYDYALTDSFSVTGALRPGVADAYIDLPLAVGGDVALVRIHDGSESIHPRRPAQPLSAFSPQPVCRAPTREGV